MNLRSIHNPRIDQSPRARLDFINIQPKMLKIEITDIAATNE
jgi:hypothetical protein